MTQTITIGGVAYQPKHGSLSIPDILNQRTIATFTIEDASGTTRFQNGQPVVINDSLLGDLFTGFVYEAGENNLPPNAQNEIPVTCHDRLYLVDKRWFTKPDYTQELFAGAIVTDLATTYMIPEGILAAVASRLDNTQATFGQGTLTNTTATPNNGGDLELALAGSPVTLTENTTATFGSGTLSNVAAANNVLQLASTQAIKLTGTAGTSVGNANVYIKVWSGSWTINSGDALAYDVWVSSTSPLIKAGADGYCSDGTTIRGSTLFDQNTVAAHPATDLSGLANDQWYSRSIDLSSISGKTLTSASVALEGDTQGDYTAYFRNIRITSSHSSPPTIFGTAQTSLSTNIVTNNVGYSKYSIGVIAAYSQYGDRISGATSLASVGIVQGSVLNWTADATPPPGTSLAIATTFDGGVTWQNATSGSAIPNLMPGMNTSGVSLQTRARFNITGPSPEVSPTLSQVTWQVNPSYACTKTDAHYIDNFGAGSNSNLQVSSGNLMPSGFWRNWDDGSLSGQTTYGSDVNASTKEIAYQCVLSATASVGQGNDARSRLDFIGQWQDFILECDMSVPAANCDIGIVYRTTNWSNASNSANSFAYRASINNTSIFFGYGTNDNSGNLTFHTLQSVTLTLNSGDWHRMKIVVSGSSHQIYLDDVLYINKTDSTYTAQGYIGLRFWNGNNGSVNTHSGFYDNFGIVTSLTGTHTSVATSIAAVGTVGNSVMQWSDELPDGASVAVSTSTDNATWHACTNGGTIPNFGPGATVAGGTSLYIQVIITLQNAAASSVLGEDQQTYLTAVVHGVTFWIAAQMNVSGTRVSPAVSCANLTRAGSTLAAWNAILPTSTNLKVEVSTNGGSSWTDITSANGHPLPGITGQGLPYFDSFEATAILYVPRIFGGAIPLATSTSADYVQTFLSGTGSLASWNWNTARSRLIGTQSSGFRGVLEYPGLTFADGFVEGIFDESDTGGLVIRMTNSNNAYYLVIRDSSANSGTQNTVTLNKIVAGTITQIQQAAISFPRGTYHNFRLDAQGSSLTVLMDGATIISATDSDLSSAGNAGVLCATATGGVVELYSMRIQPYGDIITSNNLKTRLTLTSTSPTATPQVTDLTLAAYGPTISDGLQITGTNWQFQNTLAQCLDDAAKKSSSYDGANFHNVWWTIDKGSNLLFQDQFATPAPFPIADTDMLLNPQPTFLHGADLYRNQQWVVGGSDTASYTKQVQGDGISTTFNVDYPLAAAPVIISNNGATTYAIGVQGTDTGKDFYYQIGSTGISQDSGEAPFTALLTVDYTGTFPVQEMYADTVEQAKRKALEGTGTGIVEMVENQPGLGKAASQALAQARVNQYKNAGDTITFSTLRSGLAKGQLLTVFWPEHGVNDQLYLITSVTTTSFDTWQGGAVVTIYQYAITATAGPVVGDWTKFQVALATGGLS